jgi:hypothetical protein
MDFVLLYVLARFRGTYNELYSLVANNTRMNTVSAINIPTAFSAEEV